MARKFIFEDYRPYHILNRGIDKRTIFQDETDYYRFIFLFYTCNFGSPALNLWRRDIIKAGKAILVDNENYLLRLLRYVLLNPLDLFQSDWRDKGIENQEKAFEFLTNYHWSSLPDFLGIRNSKLVTTKRLYGTFFDNFSERGIIDFRKFLMQWSGKEFNELQPLVLE